MTAIIILLVVQTIVIAAGIYFGRQRLDAIRTDLVRLERLVAQLDLRRTPAERQARPEPAMAAASADLRRQTASPARNGQNQSQSPTDGYESRLPATLFKTTRLLPIEDVEDGAAWPALEGPGLSPEVGRALIAAAALGAPALLAAFAAPTVWIMSAVLMVVLAALAASFLPVWRSAAWAAAFAGGAWAAAGLATGAAHAHPIMFSICGAIAGAAALAHTRLQAILWPGAVLAAFMAAATLMLSGALGIVGPAGASYATLAALAAIVGASTLRLEALHLAAFAAAGLGLYVLSGQPQGDVWFTPAASWMGAVFGGIAALRTPKLGHRALLISATGAVAPIFAVSAMIAARHGLETPIAGAAVFLALGAGFAAILVAAARRAGGLAPLKLTTWTLGLASAWCGGAAAMTAFGPGFAAFEACALSTLALAAILVDTRYPARVWRFAALCLGALALISATHAGLTLGRVGSDVPPLAAIFVGLIAPSALFGVAAHLSRSRAQTTSAVSETAALLLGLAAAAATMRLAFTGDALTLYPLSFAETGAHAATWLLAALALAARAGRGAHLVRVSTALVLVSAALLLSAATAVMWLSGFWSTVEIPDLSFASWLHPPIGFLLPALAAWTHWAYWRRAPTLKRAHVARCAAAALTACWLTLEIYWLRRDGAGIDWVVLSVGAFAFAAAFAATILPARRVA